jgi:putative aminopeptidase FrvX
MAELKHVELLKKVLSSPTAPFREKQVITTLTDALSQAAVPHFRDPIGNIVVGAGSRVEYRKLIARRDPEPIRFFIAHTDHPGFHGMAWQGQGSLEAKWHGGSPTKHLEGAAVWLAGPEGRLGAGRVVRASLVPSGKAIDTATLTVPVQLREKHPDPKALYGGFSFREPYWIQGDLIYTQAADDLVGAFAITSLAIDLLGGRAKSKKKAKSLPFLGLLTRAEEVGFIGAIGHLELGWLKQAKRQVIGVSLETSRTLPGAEIGKGPVVRLGDRFTVFDPGSLRVFSELASRVLPEKHQRRIMDGGTCEATTATAYGFRCVGISVPLGNYHNQSFEGGPDSRGEHGPAPEFVHLSDVAGLLALCHGLLEPKLPWGSPWDSKRKEFKKNLRDYRPLLESGP